MKSDLVTAELGPACLDDVAALAFVNGTCTPNRRTQILEHLDTCTACQELLAGVVAMLDEQKTPLATPFDTPKMIGPYRLGPQIAQGGMGRIYRAYDTSLGRDVALKVPRSGSDAIVRRFEREAAITARLEHPGIVPIHGAGRIDEGVPFYVMRFIEGRTLDALIADAATPAARLALVERVLDVARTMAYVHGKRIVHRDLKPNNVLVGAFGETLIIDWGLAKQLADGRASLPVVSVGDAATDTPATREALRTRAGEVMGTPSFMPPEQATGEHVDERTDVYALGAILRNVLTGALPHEADIAIEGPAPVVEVCRRAMAWLAEERYPDAGAFASALDTALAATRPKPPPSRSPMLLWLAAGSALVAVTIVVIMLVARRDALDAGMRRRVITRQPPDVQSLAMSPSGTRVAFGGRDRLHVVDLVSGKTWTRMEWTLWPWVTQFDSDDVVRYVVHADADAHQRMSWDVRTDATTRVSDTMSIVKDGFWLGELRDGALFMPTDDSRFLEIRRGAERTKLPSESVRQLRLFAIAPNRERVAYVDHAPAGAVIRISDLAGASFTSPRIDDIAAMSWLDDTTLIYTTGSSNGSTLWKVRATPDGLAKPAKLHTTEAGGWLGALASRGDRIVASWFSSTYEAHMFRRSSRKDSPLDTTAVSAAIGWLDDTTYLAYSSGTGMLERHSVTPRALPQVTALRLPSEPINATLAVDLVIATVRADAGRSVIAQTLTEPTPRWTTTAGTLAFVRCAGDRRPPCIAGKQGAGGLVSLVMIDPQTGSLGSDVIAEGVIADAAVDATGTEAAWVVDNRRVVVRPLDRSAPAHPLDPMHAGNHTIAYDPTGGILATIFIPEGRQIARFYASDSVPVLTAGTAIITLVRPSPDGDHISYRARTLTGDLVELQR